MEKIKYTQNEIEFCFGFDGKYQANMYLDLYDTLKIDITDLNYVKVDYNHHSLVQIPKFEKLRQKKLFKLVL